MSLETLKKKFPLPESIPNVQKDYAYGNPSGWCHGENVEMFKSLIEGREDKFRVIVDGGSWKGLSAWHFLHIAPQATVICIDTWKGSSEHQQEKYREELRILYDTFLVNLWEYRDRIIPLKNNSLDGMRRLKILGIEPDLIYIDWAHDRESVFKDVSTAIELFPNSVICGDDYTWKGVVEALEDIKKKYGMKIIAHKDICWRLLCP